MQITGQNHEKSTMLTQMLTENVKSSEHQPMVMTRGEFLKSIIRTSNINTSFLDFTVKHFMNTDLWELISPLQNDFQEDLEGEKIKIPFGLKKLLSPVMQKHAEKRGFLPYEKARVYNLLKSLRLNIFDKMIFNEFLYAFGQDVASLWRTQILNFIGHLHGYSYYTMRMDRYVHRERHMSELHGGTMEATEKNTEYFIDVKRFEKLLDEEVGIDKPKPTQKYIMKKYNLTKSSYDKISKFIDKKYHDIIFTLMANQFEQIIQHVMANQIGYTTHSTITPSELINGFLFYHDIIDHRSYIEDNFSEILQELNSTSKTSNIHIVRVYDDDYTDWTEYLMHNEKGLIYSEGQLDNVYHIIDNTKFRMNDWVFGINSIKINSWKRHILSINKITGIIDIIYDEIDTVMSECNEIYPTLFAMPLGEIENKVLDANKQVLEVYDNYTIPDSVFLNHLRENYVSIRYERAVNLENEGTIKKTEILWTTEYVASKEIGWKRGNKSPIAFHDGDTMRLKKGN